MYFKVLKRDKKNVSAKYNFLHTLGYYCLCFLYYDFPILKFSNAALPIYFLIAQQTMQNVIKILF